MLAKVLTTKDEGEAYRSGLLRAFQESSVGTSNPNHIAGLYTYGDIAAGTWRHAGDVWQAVTSGDVEKISEYSTEGLLGWAFGNFVKKAKSFRNGRKTACPPDSPPRQRPVADHAPNVPDEAVVHFGGAQYDVINVGAGGKSYWFRYGDIKNLTPKQIETVIGDAASSGRPGGARVMHVLEDVKATEIRGGRRGFPEYVFRNEVRPTTSIVVQGPVQK
jgi:hypothetical protein